MKSWKEHLPEKPRTLTELYGCERLLVEQHRGIVGYGSDCIRIGTTFGILEVCGQQLRLCCMSPTQVVIRGRIAGIRILGDGIWS